MSKELIHLNNISKSFDGQMVLDELNLTIHENEFVTLLAQADAVRLPICASWAALLLPIPEPLFLTAKTSQMFPLIKDRLTRFFRSTLFLLT